MNTQTGPKEGFESFWVRLQALPGDWELAEFGTERIQALKREVGGVDVMVWLVPVTGATIKVGSNKPILTENDDLIREVAAQFDYLHRKENEQKVTRQRGEMEVVLGALGMEASSRDRDL